MPIRSKARSRSATIRGTSRRKKTVRRKTTQVVIDLTPELQPRDAKKVLAHVRRLLAA